MFSFNELAVIKKDFNELWSRNGIRMIIVAVPVIMAILLPVTCIAALYILAPETGEAPQIFINLLSAERQAEGVTYRQALYTAFTKSLCPMFFMMIPIVCSVTASATAFISEKEDGTLETLFLSSLESKSIFKAKAFCSALTSLLISAVSALAIVITMTVGDIMMGATLFFDFNWLFIFAFFAPSAIFFCVSVMSLMIHRTAYISEALQVMGYITFPVVVFFLLQFCGVIRINPLVLLIISLCLFGAGVLLFRNSEKRFQPEILVSLPAEEENED